jgi:catechol 2,3-dioxygenase-like lactoylglutathione lyase family enzyme
VTQGEPASGRTTAVHHFGYSVSDADRTAAFWKELGGVVVADTPLFGEEIDEGLGLPQCHLRIVMITIGEVLVELLEYRAPVPRPYDLRNCDVGAAHVAVRVDDIHAVYEALKPTVPFFSPPVLIREGPFAGGWFCYCRDPDGVSVELLKSPVTVDAEPTTG